MPTLLIITVQPPAPTGPASQRQNRQAVRPTAAVDSQIAQADALALESRFGEADALYAAAVQASPRSAFAYAHWARALLWDLRTEDALGKALLATQLDATNAEGFVYLARVRDWLGQVQEAVAAGERAVELDPGSADAHALLAEVYVDAGRLDEARTAAEQALQIDPDSPEAHRSLAYLLAAENNLDEAIKHAERAAQVQSGLWLRFDDLATMLRLIGDHEQASRFSQWAIDIRPKAVSYTGLGLSQIEIDRIEDAQASFGAAIDLDPNSAMAHGGLALAYARLDRCDLAAPESSAALGLDPNNAVAIAASDLCAGAPTQAAEPAPATPRIIAVPTVSAPIATPMALPPLQLPVPTQSFQPPPPPLPALAGRIAYSVFDGERRTFDVYIANLDGSGRGRLIADAGSPALSPDGRQIAYRSWDPGGKGLFVRTVGGTDVRVLTTQYYSEDTLPAWSPPGNQIAFSSRRESDRRTRVYLANPAGKDDSVIRIGADAAYGEHPGWLRDGRIVFNGCLGSNCGLLVMNSDGGGPYQLTSQPNDTAPDASPDGSWVAFTSNRDGNWEVYLVSTAGGDPIRLTFENGNDGQPTWSPDSRSIAFASDRGGRWAIWVMNADGSNQRLLLEPEGALDGRVREEPDYASRGWIDENISWVP